MADRVRQWATWIYQLRRVPHTALPDLIGDWVWWLIHRPNYENGRCLEGGYDGNPILTCPRPCCCDEALFCDRLGRAELHGHANYCRFSLSPDQKYFLQRRFDERAVVAFPAGDDQ